MQEIRLLTDPDPKQWAFQLFCFPDGSLSPTYFGRNGIKVIRTVHDNNEYGDERIWMHVSFSRKDRIPDYKDVCLVKKVFVGPDLEAYQVHPPASRHVNIHPNCLHLWVPLEGPVLPKFEIAGIGI